MTQFNRPHDLLFLVCNKQPSEIRGLSCIIFEIFRVDEYPDFEIWISHSVTHPVHDVYVAEIYRPGGIDCLFAADSVGLSSIASTQPAPVQEAQLVLG